MEDILLKVLDAVFEPVAIAAALAGGFFWLRAKIFEKLDEIVKRTSTDFDDRLLEAIKEKLGVAETKNTPDSE